MKYALEQTSIPASDFPTLGIMEIEENILQSWADLTTAEQNMRETQELMFNAQRSISLLKRFGDSMIPQLNLDKGLEELLGLEESAITAEKAIEGLVDSIKEGIKKFIEYVKELFDKIRIWIKNFINRLRGNSGVKISDIIRKAGKESKVKKITSKLIDKETVANIGRLVSEAAKCKSVIAQVVTLTNVDEVRDISNKLFFDETSSGVVVKTNNYSQSNGNFKRLNNDGSLFKNHNSRLIGTGVDINEIQSLENSILSLTNELSAFENACDSSKNKIISRLETMDEKADEYRVLEEIVNVLTFAIKRNAAFCGILKKDIDGIFKKLSGNNDNESTNQPNRPAPVDTSDKIKARVAIVRQIDKDEKNPKNQWAYKLALEADKAFKSKGVNDFFEEDDGLVYNKVIEIKAALRTNFSAVKIKRIMGLIENGANGSGNLGLRIKAKVDAFIKNNDKEGLKTFIINELLSHPESYRFALKAADLAQKSFSDGFYHEPEVAISTSDTADALKKKLKMFFTRGILSRIVSLLSNSGTK